MKKMTSSDELIACNILERDINGDVLWTWTFPAVSEEQKNLILRKCRLDNDHAAIHQFVYGRYGKCWYNIFCSDSCESEKLHRIKQFALVLWTKDFNPRKYEMLCKILSKTYSATGNPALLLQLYLSVLTKGSCSTDENGTFLAGDFETKSNPTYTILKDLIKAFGLETILIYTSLLLKKRIIVYHHSLEALLKSIATFPAMMSHRKAHEILYPWFDLVPEELVDLKSSGCYVAGCCDSAVGARQELYDLLVNLPAREITIAPHAKESLLMTKIHKDIAMFMVQLAEDDNISELQIIQEVADKTKELLLQLRALATVETADGNYMVSVETLKEKNLPQALDNFLFNLAVAENMLML